ncbi:hypothetical protein B6D60_07485 [candidate division KSB1 bacterium 4484_87]|nr:MAG: hypothetical protein B6D60_07485 [candidate division KSB1 bacterium 4484_87]
MKKSLFLFMITALTIFLIVPSGHAQKKLAQTGFQFMSVGLDARATSMAEAFTTVDGSSICMFYNPAGLASVDHFVDMSFSTMNWIADIKYSGGTVALNYGQGHYGVFGFSFLTVDYGQFEWTRVAENEQGFEDIGELLGNPKPNAYAFGLSYARQLTDRFSVGGQVKYVYQNLGSSFAPVYTEEDTIMEKKKYDLDVFSFDFGTIYRTGFRSLVFGMTIRNFSREIKYEKESFQLPLTFKIGISMNAFDLVPISSEYHKLNISVDAVHPRSFPEYVSIGGEYDFMNMIFLRAGYMSSHDEYNLSYGVGFKVFGLGVDYSYVPFDVFDDINRITVNFTF